MKSRTNDIHIRAAKALISPAVLQDDLPLGDEQAKRIQAWRQQVTRIITGKDKRLMVIVGPCSIHDPLAALDYASRLHKLASRLEEDLLIIMRVYFEKPRTTVGWKGMINDPGLDGSFRINDGLRLARKLLLDINSLGLPAANEFLDTVIGQYFADLITWGCIGARTVESQIHRELASGLSMPVGFKTRTDGDVQVAAEAMQAARHPHWFPSLTREGAPAVLGTSGNPATHLVLRGGSVSGPNHDAAAVAAAATILGKAKLPRRVMIDCSHAHSGKDPARQPVVANAIARRVAEGNRDVLGVMLESHLVGGRQDPIAGKPLTYGQSITDACLGWNDTKKLLGQLAKASRAGRHAGLPSRHQGAKMKRKP